MRDVDVKKLHDPRSILFMVGDRGKTVEELVAFANGSEKAAAKMIETGMVREIPTRPGEYAGTWLGRWFLNYAHEN